MKFVRNEKGIYAVFSDEDAAHEKYWLFGFILRRKLICFGGYFNAYKLW